MSDILRIVKQITAPFDCRVDDIEKQKREVRDYRNNQALLRALYEAERNAAKYKRLWVAKCYRRGGKTRDKALRAVFRLVAATVPSDNDMWNRRQNAAIRECKSIFGEVSEEALVWAANYD